MEIDIIKGVLIPAYGRTYKSVSEVEKEFKDGKDFIFLNPSSQYNGKYCSIRDFESGNKLELRFNKSHVSSTIFTV